MYWLAINREPVAISELREDVISLISSTKLLEALESLLRRSLIEKATLTLIEKSQTVALFTLQPVVMEYVTDRLIEQVCIELNTGRLALFNTHALIKAQAKDFVRSSQVRLILKPVANTLLSTLSKKEVESNLQQILSILRQKSPLRPGYAAGNTINLLVQLKSDLTSYHFSDLAVWQAYLQGVDLHNVNFTRTDLKESVFTQTFCSIHTVAFSPNGELLAAGTASGEVRLWRADGQQIFIRKGHSDWVRSVAFSPDGCTLVK